MSTLPNAPRTLGSLLLRLLVAAAAAVPPYLVLAYCEWTWAPRVLASIVAFIPGILAIMWVGRRY